MNKYIHTRMEGDWGHNLIMLTGNSNAILCSFMYIFACYVTLFNDYSSLLNNQEFPRNLLVDWPRRHLLERSSE